MSFAKRLVTLVVALLLSAAATAEAQSIWLPRSEPAIAIEGLKPFFEVDGFSFFSTAWYLSGRARVSGSLIVVGEVPFAFASFDSGFSLGPASESDAAIGNIYVGLEIGKEEAPVFFEVGVRAPTAPEGNLATAVGIAADLDRWEAFVPNLLPFTGMVNYMNVSDTGLLLRFRGGGVLWVPTESGGDAEFLAMLNALVGYENPMGKFGVKGGITSRIIVSEGGSFGDRSSFQAGANGWLGLGRVRPGVLILIPLEDTGVDVTVGLNAQILIN